MTFPNADGDEGEGALARQEGVVRWRQNHGKKRDLELKPWEKEGIGILCSHFSTAVGHKGSERHFPASHIQKNHG